MSAAEQTAFSALQRASFDGVEFPYEDIEIVGVIRDYIHEFPHTPTGKPEKMGRKNYEFRIRVPFFAGFPAYPDLWPERIGLIQGYFENQLTKILHIPTMGDYRAYIRSFDRQTVSSILNGERGTLVFIEDDNPQTDISFNTLTTIGPVSIDKQLGQVIQKASLSETPGIGSLLTALDESVTALIAVRDQVDIYGNLIEAKTLRVSAQCEALDRAFRINNGDGAAIDANLALWANIIRSTNDIKEKQTDLVVFITPSAMSITDLSIKLYNDTTHATELLQINAVSDPLRIPPNTRIKYYPDD